MSQYNRQPISRNNSRANSNFGGRKYTPRPFRRRNDRSSSRKKKFTSAQIDRAMYVNDLQGESVLEKAAYKGKNYSDYNFERMLARNLDIKGFKTTTEIQEKVIPMIMNGDDVLGISATGSGKTGAFLIPLIQKLLIDKNQRLLIVAPTRELAMQIYKEALSLVRGTHLQLAQIIGGEYINRQIDQLNRGGHIVVGTPGRLKDIVQQGFLNLGSINNVVIDEVDRMLDMGFIDDIKQILEQTSSQRQTLLFSATLDHKVEAIVNSILKSYEIVRLSNNSPSKNVVQSVVDYTHMDEKIELLQDILKKEEVEKAIIFVDTKRFADLVDKILYKNKFKVAVIHGDKRQNVRKKVIELFRSSKVNILVATNVAARGIDIDDITHVINLDEPQTYDEYIHRIGRTGRNGALGTAYTFVKR